jgi:prepilin-type N-terminal cleavage/methylation domain-containing protein
MSGTNVAARPTREAGTSMIELLVAMSIMSVLGSLFVAGVVQMYRTETLVEAR